MARQISHLKCTEYYKKSLNLDENGNYIKNLFVYFKEFQAKDQDLTQLFPVIF